MIFKGEHEKAESIVALASQLQAALHIVHVDPATQGQTPDKKQGKQELLGMLSSVNPLFEVVGEARDKAEGLFDYVKRHRVDLILMASRNYGFFERLFPQQRQQKAAQYRRCTHRAVKE